MITGFGYPPPECPQGVYQGPYFGCRSIYTPPISKAHMRWVTKGKKKVQEFEPYTVDAFVDIVHDRKGYQNMTEDFSEWINIHFEELLKWLNDNFIQPDSREVFRVEAKPGESGYKYVLCASCQGSYGYLYIGAWVEPWEKETNDGHQNP